MTLQMDITRQSIPKADWLYSLQLKMEKLYTVRKIRPAVDCCSYHELLIWKFRIKLRKSGKTIRLSNHNQNGKPIIIKILYDYTVEVMNRCKGWELGGRVHEELWKEVPNTVRRQWLKLSMPNKKKCRKPKWLSEEALQILKLRKGEKWKAREKVKIYSTECRVPDPFVPKSQ